MRRSLLLLLGAVLPSSAFPAQARAKDGAPQRLIFRLDELKVESPVWTPGPSIPGGAECAAAPFLFTPGRRLVACGKSWKLDGPGDPVAAGEARTLAISSSGDLSLVQLSKRKIGVILTRPDGSVSSSIAEFGWSPAAAMTPDGIRLALQDGREVEIWGLFPRAKMRTVEACSKHMSRMNGDGPLQSLLFSQNGDFLLAQCVWDKTTIFRTYTGEKVAEIPHNSGAQQSLALQPKGSKLAVSSAQKSPVIIYDFGDWTSRPLRLQGIQADSLGIQPTPSVAWHPTLPVLAAGFKDGSVRLLDSRTGRDLQRLQVQGKADGRLAFSPPDGRGRSILAVLPRVEDGKAEVRLWLEGSALDGLARLGEDDGPLDTAALDAELDAKLAAVTCAPKGEFETTAEFEERRRRTEESKEALRKEHSQRKTREQADWNTALARRKAETHPFFSTVKIGRYDADKGGFQAELEGGPSLFVSVPREKAQALAKDPSGLYFLGRLAYRGKSREGDADRVSVELVDACLWDSRTDERFWLAGEGAAVSGAAPDLSIASLSFSEASGDGFLDAGETGSIKVLLRNAGKGPARGVSLRLEPDKSSSLPGLSFDGTVFVGDIPPGEEKYVQAAVAGSESLPAGGAVFKAVLAESRGYDSKPMGLEFKTREFQSPLLQLAGAEIQDPDGGRSFSKGKECELTFAVRNAGKGPARGAALVLKSGDPQVRITGETRAAMGELAPGALKKASFSVFVTRRYEGPSKLPLTLSIEEERPRFAAAPDLGLELGQEPGGLEIVRVQAKEGAASAPQEGIETPPSLADTAKVLGENDFAVVIGVERYREVPKSEHSYGDAKLVRAYLSALGVPSKNIQFLGDDSATLSAFGVYLDSWLRNRVKKESRVFVYYSGHGAPQPDTGEAFLLPYDGKPEYLADTAYPLAKLYANLGKLPAKEVLVLLDSCFSGAGGRSVLAKGARPLVLVKDRPSLPPNVAVLTASDAAQISTSSPERGHGLFTYHLLEALKRGMRDALEVYEDLKPRVENEAMGLNVSQTPQLLPDAGSVKGRFPFRK